MRIAQHIVRISRRFFAGIHMCYKKNKRRNTQNMLARCVCEILYRLLTNIDCGMAYITDIKILCWCANTKINFLGGSSMRKFIFTIVAASILASLTACNGSNRQMEPPSPKTNTTENITSTAESTTSINSQEIDSNFWWWSCLFCLNSFLRVLPGTPPLSNEISTLDLIQVTE